MNEAQLPKRVDSIKLVDNNQSLSAEIDGGSLMRLNDAVVRHTDPVKVSLSFYRDQERLPVIDGHCETQVVMQCQRCLNDVTIDISSEFYLGLVHDDEQAKNLPRRLEPVEIDEYGRLDLWEIVEDEVLLNLPDFPMHPPGECQLMQRKTEEEADENIEKPNPFDVLKQLKQN